MSSEVPNVSATGRYDINLAANTLGIHRNTLRRIPESLLPKHYHLNGRTFYFGEDLQRYWRLNVRN